MQQPYPTMSYYVLLYPTILYSILLSFTLSWHVLLCPTLPYYVLLCPTMSNMLSNRQPFRILNQVVHLSTESTVIATLTRRKRRRDRRPATSRSSGRNTNSGSCFWQSRSSSSFANPSRWFRISTRSFSGTEMIFKDCPGRGPRRGRTWDLLGFSHKQELRPLADFLGRLNRLGVKARDIRYFVMNANAF